MGWGRKKRTDTHTRLSDCDDGGTGSWKVAFGAVKSVLLPCVNKCWHGTPVAAGPFVRKVFKQTTEEKKMDF